MPKRNPWDDTFWIRNNQVRMAHPMNEEQTHTIMYVFVALASFIIGVMVGLALATF